MKKFINSNELKMIAVIAMTLDHIAWLLYPGYAKNYIPIILHIIGRIAFPIFAYCIAEGYYYTHDAKRYMRRLLVLALISHIPYMMASTVFQTYGWRALLPFSTGYGINRFLNQTSVIWSYYIGLKIMQVAASDTYKKFRVPLIVLLCLLGFPSDWSCIGSLVVVSIASNRNHPKTQLISSFIFIGMYALVYCLAIDLVYGLLQFCTILAVPIIGLYNGNKGKGNSFMKWSFYVYYPLHLLIIGLIGVIK